MFYRKRSLLLFLLPGLIILILFYIAPFFEGFYYSMTDGTFHNRFVGFDNYSRLWQNQMFTLGLKNTILLSTIGALLLWLLSFLAALILQNVRNLRKARSILLMPYFLPSSVMLLIWLVLFDFGGPVNKLVQSIGLERILWLESSDLRITVLLMYLWKNFGVCLAVFLAGLQAIPVSLYEYATLEGAGILTKAFRITLPQIRPVAMWCLLLAWINAIRSFTDIYSISGAYPDEAVYTLQHYINNRLSRLDYQMATSAAFSFTVIIAVAWGIIFLARKSASEK